MKNRKRNQLIRQKSTSVKAYRFEMQKIKLQLWKEYGNICVYCGKPFIFKDLTLDHIVPLTKDGKSNKKNLVLCCQSCNSKKGDKFIWECMNIITNPNPPRIIVERIKDYYRKKETK